MVPSLQIFNSINFSEGGRSRKRKGSSGTSSQKGSKRHKLVGSDDRNEESKSGQTEAEQCNVERVAEKKQDERQKPSRKQEIDLPKFQWNSKVAVDRITQLTPHTENWDD